MYLIWGLLRHCRTLRWWLEAAADCWQGPQYDENALSILSVNFSVQQPTNRDLREKAVYFPPQMDEYWMARRVLMGEVSGGQTCTRETEPRGLAKIFSDYFWLIFIPTEDLGNSFLLILCFMPTNTQIIQCFMRISKNYHSYYILKRIVLVSLQFLKGIVLVTFQKASFLSCSKIDRAFLASLWFV